LTNSTTSNQLANVSVIIPCRNMAQYLGEAIESALTQRPCPREIVVIDDESTDDSRQVASSFRSPVRLISGPGRGSAVARNLGILASTHDLIAFLDADDYWLPGKLANQLRLLSEPATDACFTDWYEMEDGQLGQPVFGSRYPMVQDGKVFRALLEGNFILTSSLVCRRSALGAAGLFNPMLRGAQDYELWLRLSRTSQFAWEKQALTVKRKHSTNITSQPSYSYLRTLAVQVIYDTHWASADCEERRLLDSMASSAHFESGRQALRSREFEHARVHFDHACAPRWARARYKLWRAVSNLPDPTLDLLTRLNRRLRRQ
jgi:glycosyltransferase involved in cell wall biosynthesis